MSVTIKGVTTIKANTTVGFSPASLFAAGEQGVWYDPSDFSTMFQDTAGTTPVTATGQSVALIRDKSGRGNHATQSTAANRPTLQVDANGCYYLSFDGTNDSLATSSVNFSSTAQIYAFCGERKLSDGAVRVLVELSSDAGASGSVGAFTMYKPTSAAYSTLVHGSGAASSYADTSASYAAPITNTLIYAYDLSKSTSALKALVYVDGSQVTLGSFTNTTGTGNFGNFPLYIGSRGGSSLYWYGYLYSLIIRGAASSSQQISATENWVNTKTKAY